MVCDGDIDVRVDVDVRVAVDVRIFVYALMFMLTFAHDAAGRALPSLGQGHSQKLLRRHGGFRSQG